MVTYKDTGSVVDKIYDQSGRGNDLLLSGWPLQEGSDGSFRILTPKKTAEFNEFFHFDKPLSTKDVKKYA